MSVKIKQLVGKEVKHKKAIAIWIISLCKPVRVCPEPRSGIKPKFFLNKDRNALIKLSYNQ